MSQIHRYDQAREGFTAARNLKTTVHGARSLTLKLHERSKCSISRWKIWLRAFVLAVPEGMRARAAFQSERLVFTRLVSRLFLRKSRFNPCFNVYILVLTCCFSYIKTFAVILKRVANENQLVLIMSIF